MSDYLCQAYYDSYNKEYLFSNECVEFEIQYHVDAYMWTQGYSGYSRNITTYAFSKKELIEHCKTIDISTKDIDTPKQKIMFNYRNGIRDCYKWTDADPFLREGSIGKTKIAWRSLF